MNVDKKAFFTNDIVDCIIFIFDIMKNIAFLTLLCVCLGNWPLAALKGKDDDTPENPKPVAAAASLNESQATTPAMAKAAPRKVVSRPEIFVLNAEACTIMQSTAPGQAKAKEDLLENAARAVGLRIMGPLTLPDDTTALMAPFANVRSLSIEDATLDDLLLLPCPDKLESLMLSHSVFQTIQTITHYTNLHTLQLANMSLRITDQHPNHTDRLAVLTQLHNLRTLNCWTLFTLDDQAPEERALLIRILDSNPEIEDFTCAGGVATDVVQALGNLPLRRLLLMNGEIDNDKLALLPFDTLEELRLQGTHTLTNLEPLQGSALRVFRLHNQANLDDTLPQVICSMPHLEELDLSCCRLTDAHVEPLLQLAPQLQKLTLVSHTKITETMRQRLQNAFGDKVSLAIFP
ncbi:MAG: hypothetical protein ACPG7U_02525 [Holosporaceae bacterium]